MEQKPPQTKGERILAEHNYAFIDLVKLAADIDNAIAKAVATERERAVNLFSDWLNDAEQSIDDLYDAVLVGAAKESKDGA
jgi:hypothetical protein